MKLTVFSIAALILVSQHCADASEEITVTTFYHLAVHEGQSREDAEKACEDLGMTLAVIPTMFARNRVGDINPLAQHEAFWIGAKKNSSLPAAQQWQWDTDEALPTFSELWMTGEPKADPNNEFNCLAYEERWSDNYPTQGFTTQKCSGSDVVKGYICEERAVW